MERFPKPVRQRLQQIRRTIQKAAPRAQDTISYRMPAFTFLDRMGFGSRPGDITW